MTGMEDVLTAHAFIGFDHDYGELHCKCGRSLEPSDADPDSREPHAAHVAEALQAAGFGSQHDAWDRCVNHVIASCTYVTSTAEEWRHKRLYSDLCEVRDSNPYSAPKVSET